MEKSTGRFAAYFYKVIEEDMTAGDAGVGSTGGDDMQGAHVYGDPDDTRIAKPLGKIQSRIAKKKKKKKKAIKKVVKVVDEENEEVKVVKVDDISDYM